MNCNHLVANVRRVLFFFSSQYKMSQKQSFLIKANHCVNIGSRGPDVEENERRAGGTVENDVKLE